MWLTRLVTSSAASEIDFARDIRPVLSEYCFFCHGPDAQQRQADLRLDKQSGSAGVVQAGMRSQSELFRRIASQDPEEVMPPLDAKRQLSREQIELLGRWIDAGAEWETHWAFRPLVRPGVPDVARGDEHPIRNPIDAFVQHELAEARLSPNPEAERATLIRRLSLDLTGLPAPVEQVRAFVSSKDPQAYDHLVETLLNSPGYGERMAWEWLDAARYADSNGYQGDNERTMWPWRDWVVAAFNENLPFDQFTIWQLAGDLLPAASDEQKLATGFLRNHMINGEGGRIAEENRVEYVFDMSETTSTVWLGLTMNCCRCHDHKYDPLTNRDYYSFFAYFDQTPVTGKGGDPQMAPNMAVPSAAQRAQLNALQTSIVRQTRMVRQLESEFSRQFDSGLEGSGPCQDRAVSARIDRSPLATIGAYKRATRELASLAKQKLAVEKVVPRVMVMQDMVEPRKTYMLQRGLYNRPTEQVSAGTPKFLVELPSDKQDRLALARWIVSDENPLTARVTVNRIWQQLFGVGLVKTVEDFGAQGETPVYLDLLNWLAADFRDNGWNMKELIRTLVTSHTYRQSSRLFVAQQYELDPQNRLLARGARHRLPAWMLRDQALAVSGLLSDVRSGPAVNTYQPAGVWEEATFGKKTYKLGTGEELYRRSLFIFWRRIIAPTMFFDNASRQTCTVKGSRTNTPLHALLTLNDTTFVEAARAMAQLALRSAATGEAERLNLVMLRLLAREADPSEQEILLSGLARSRRQFVAAPENARKLLAIGQSARDESLDAIEHASWTTLCLSILNLDEALNRE